jgi:hypothetical protein
MTITPIMNSGKWRTVAATGAWLFAFGTFAQGNAGPFDPLAGQWTGDGAIQMSDGAKEKIRCRASYDILDNGSNLQLNLRCAGDSYNFDLRGGAKANGGVITGTWSESTYNASGNLVGRVSGDKIDVTAKSSDFSVNLALTTRGNRQSVSIKANGLSTAIAGATISLRRS